jgi:hypothetical protein
MIIFQKAKSMNVNKIAAARMRVRRLIEELEVYIDDGSDLAIIWAKENIDEILYLLDKCRYETLPSKNTFNQVTDEMIQQAKDYPIERLLEFNNGKALAFCHDDTKPSLSKYRNANKAHCFVCNKSFNPIDIVMHFNGTKYYDSVRYLCES